MYAVDEGARASWGMPTLLSAVVRPSVLAYNRPQSFGNGRHCAIRQVNDIRVPCLGLAFGYRAASPPFRPNT